ncbi:hypothetical protein Sjap_026350 [Stephania japonica]|uniref:Uncharacterized protein n=1 Tax=Stephania japonica TaxID=461633 RepID=A0AAP0E3J4_9MAGN
MEKELLRLIERPGDHHHEVIVTPLIFDQYFDDHKYTSLKDIMKSQGCSPNDYSNVSIRNRLVQQAASAYILSSATLMTRREHWMIALWRKMKIFKLEYLMYYGLNVYVCDPLRACIERIPRVMAQVCSSNRVFRFGATDDDSYDLRRQGGTKPYPIRVPPHGLSPPSTQTWVLRDKIPDFTSRVPLSWEHFPGGQPSWYYSRSGTLNCGVLMGSGAFLPNQLSAQWFSTREIWNLISQDPGLSRRRRKIVWGTWMGAGLGRYESLLRNLVSTEYSIFLESHLEKGHESLLRNLT